MEDFIFWGTIVNTIAVLVGSGIGLVWRFFSRRSIKRKRAQLARDAELTGSAETWTEPKKKPYIERLNKALLYGFALCVLYIGIMGMMDCSNPLVLILSMVFGVCIGEALDLDRGIKRLGERLERATKGKYGDLAEGFVNASLLFCVGAMTINGAIMSGLGQGHDTLIYKSVLDFFSSIVYAAAMGVGVVLSSAFVFVLEGSLVGITAIFGSLLTPYMIEMMGAIGSLLIIGLGLNILGATKIKIMNLVPAIFMPVILCLLIPA